MRKRIAVLVAQVDEATQKSFLTGLIREAYSYDYDVCIFAMYQKFQMTDRRNVGDSNIYQLINYSLFDAIVIVSDTILVPGIIDQLYEKIKSCFKGPVLVIDKEHPDFDSVMMDHYTPFRKIVDHMLEVHDYRDIAFLGGKEGHPHSVQRYNAFCDSMNAHGVEIRNEWIYHGNYWYDSAEVFVDRLLADREHMPRAIICANDIMAIGAAARLAENGIRIPEDVAVTGYDSLESGRTSPSPLVSASIPSDQCGAYSVRKVHAMLNGGEIKPFVSDAPIVKGGSCGCHYEIEMVPKAIRSQWKTPQSSRSMFSDFDHMLEDLLATKSLVDFLKLIVNYSYQIKPFYSFDICFNDGYERQDGFSGDNAIRHGYTENMNCVLSFEGDESTIDFHNRFRTDTLTPRLYEQRDYPTAFIFNPIYSEDNCYGYTVLSYGKEACVSDSAFRLWMRDVMQGMEAFNRQAYMLSLVERMKADQIRDSLTGLYNYQGFSRVCNEVFFRENAVNAGSERKINIVTFDIKGIRQINELYGRRVGERAIRAVAAFIQHNLYEGEIPCRMSGDEFIVAFCDDDDRSREKRLLTAIEERLYKYSLVVNSDYVIQLNHGSMLGQPANMGDFDLLVNQAISIKNHLKDKTSVHASEKTADVVNELRVNQAVLNILNRNLFTYYYQPIVSAKDGSVYAYEALMRSEAEKVSPFQIIQSASYLNRLPDIEKYTLLNVTADVESRIDEFGDAKIFINSLPGIDLSEEDESEFARRVMGNSGRFVIEFTEESQLDDEKLNSVRQKYSRYGCKTALDDFGTGYSNISNLFRYSPYCVKIDRSLITDIHKSPQKQHLVKSLASFAKEYNVLSLAEGVETREELMECLHLGVDLIQGYYTGRPQHNPVGQIDQEIRNDIIRVRSHNFSWEAF